MAAQVIGAAVHVQFDGQVHPKFLNAIGSTGLDVRCERSEPGADGCAPSGG